jgi:pimeloyl-ACP methyl ester carboxylesterase
MPAITLIHGSTQNASCWDLVRPFLHESGHTTATIELPADRPDFSASDFANLAAEQIADDAVVVAHSASGILLPLIAERRRVQALVYVAAVIPVAGMSVMQQIESDPEMLSSEWVSAGPRWSDPANWRELAERFLFHDVVADDREWAYSTLRPMRLDAAFREPLTFSNQPDVRSLCVIAVRDRTINPKWQERVWRARGAGTISLLHSTSGHCPHVSTPREIASKITIAADAEQWRRLEQLIAERSAAGCNYVPPEPLAEPIDYDAFMQTDNIHERMWIFNAMSRENRAEVVRTQIRRWRDANRERLSEAQLALLEEQIQFIHADRFQHPQQDADLARRDELMDRAYGLFRREELWNLTIRAPHIPAR